MDADALLVIAAQACDVDAIRAALANGANPSAVDDRSRTALHWGASMDRLDIVETMIAVGCDLEARNFLGRTALHHAGTDAIVVALVAANADVNSVDHSLGATPLEFKALEGMVESVRALVEAGADVMAANRDLFTPMHMAAIRAHTEVVTVLLEAGADPNAQANRVGTPLHSACFGGTDADPVPTVDALVQGGADLNLTARNDGRTPLFVAVVETRNLDLITFLLDAGADPLIRAADGLTPAEWARSRGRDAVADHVEKFIEATLVGRVAAWFTLMGFLSRDDAVGNSGNGQGSGRLTKRARKSH